jgi:hypothetical protein
MGCTERPSSSSFQTRIELSSPPLSSTPIGVAELGRIIAHSKANQLSACRRRLPSPIRRIPRNVGDGSRLLQLVLAFSPPIPYR